jgi:hypothetical protein
MNIKMLINHCLIGLTFNYLYEYKFDKDWDSKLRRMLEGGITLRRNRISSEYLTGEATLNGTKYVIWIGNRPYSYGYVWSINDVRLYGRHRYRPSIWTMMKLSSAVDTQLKIIKDAEV